MEFDHNNIRVVQEEEDRLSRLPDELIHTILSCLDMKFVVQICLMSSRWKLLWTSMPHLNFSSGQFRLLHTFAKFVTRVLSNRNHQIDVFSVKLQFHEADYQAPVIIEEIAKYAFSHNVQELTVLGSFSGYRVQPHYVYPSCLFSSQSLKHLNLSYNNMTTFSITTETPWDFAALTTLHLSDIKLHDDLSINCVNLKKLTLERFRFMGLEVFEIIIPQVSNLVLIEGSCSKVINLIAPQLENLTITECSFENLHAPPGISSLCFNGYYPRQLSEDGFDYLNKVNLCLSLYTPYKVSDEEVASARNTIYMLHEFGSVRYLTLNVDIVEYLSFFPDLLSLHTSPFSNLKSLTIDYTNTKMKDAQKVRMSSQVKNFLLENSPGAKFIINLPCGASPVTPRI